ncbi:hypothetical protein PR048_015649 [Dryococelus australis]|uniref:Uncharacterized protein n=1 Tax=Dryococelus australis TaxID=614101 RepID=A0ABQ9HHT5_9NEOP|nr:hypothetical protein PR048_015649 [Dryococelus australis]
MPPFPSTIDKLRNSMTTLVAAVTPDKLANVWDEFYYRVNVRQGDTLQTMQLDFVLRGAQYLHESSRSFEWLWCWKETPRLPTPCFKHHIRLCYTSRAPFPTGSLPDFRMWESYLPPLQCGTAPYSPRFTPIVSQDLAVKSHPDAPCSQIPDTTGILASSEHARLLCRPVPCIATPRWTQEGRKNIYISLTFSNFNPTAVRDISDGRYCVRANASTTGILCAGEGTVRCRPHYTLTPAPHPCPSNLPPPQPTASQNNPIPVPAAVSWRWRSGPRLHGMPAIQSIHISYRRSKPGRPKITWELVPSCCATYLRALVDPGTNFRCERRIACEHILGTSAPRRRPASNLTALSNKDLDLVLTGSGLEQSQILQEMIRNWLGKIDRRAYGNGASELFMLRHSDLSEANLSTMLDLVTSTMDLGAEETVSQSRPATMLDDSTTMLDLVLLLLLSTPDHLLNLHSGRKFHVIPHDFPERDMDCSTNLFVATDGTLNSAPASFMAAWKPATIRINVDLALNTDIFPGTKIGYDRIERGSPVEGQRANLNGHRPRHM